MSRRAVQLLLAAALATCACRDRAQHREGMEADGQPGRGLEMLAAARACEAEPPRADRCAAACRLGHSNSCARAGDLARDPAEARALHDRACDGGSGLGCAAAGRDREARFYLRVHCQQRHAASCRALGRLFAEARGGPADLAAAATFAREACRLGDRAACAGSR